jgi:hypothetical protein
MTFANDHKVSIINVEEDSIMRQSCGVKRSATMESDMSLDQSHMLHSFKRHLRKIANSHLSISAQRVARMAAEWEKMNGDRAAQKLEECRPLLSRLVDQAWRSREDSFYLKEESTDDRHKLQQQLLHTHKSVSSQDVASEREEIEAAIRSAQVTWRDLFCAVCWERLRANKIEKDKSVKLALDFLEKYHAEAAFLAAACFYSPTPILFDRLPAANSHNICKEIALTFMQEFPDQMDEWFSYNAKLEEPFFGLEATPKGCVCIPRHIGTCSGTARLTG